MTPSWEPHSHCPLPQSQRGTISRFEPGFWREGWRPLESLGRLTQIRKSSKMAGEVKAFLSLALALPGCHGFSPMHTHVQPHCTFTPVGLEGCSSGLLKGREQSGFAGGKSHTRGPGWNGEDGGLHWYVPLAWICLTFSRFIPSFCLNTS